MMARGIPAGLHRNFAFQLWPGFQETIWQGLKGSLGSSNGANGAILASDRDDGVVKSAIENAQRAGVDGAIQFTSQAVSSINPPPAPGWIVTNPPYGGRVGETRSLRNLYSQLGNVLRQKASGYSVSLLSADRKLERMVGIPLEPRFSTRNGGIPVRLVTGDVP